MAKPRGTDSAKVMQVIETKTLRGSGTHEDLCREVKQYWDFDGNLLAENDPCSKEKEWIPTTEQLPKTEGGYAYVMVSMDDGLVCTTDYTDSDGFGLWADSVEVIAWRPLPEPYKPEN